MVFVFDQGVGPCQPFGQGVGVDDSFLGWNDL